MNATALLFLNDLSSYGCAVMKTYICEKDDPKTGIRWQRQPLILLVEDNMVNQDVGVAHLNYLGCKVLSAADGYEAVDMVRKNIFDVVF